MNAKLKKLGLAVFLFAAGCFWISLSFKGDALSHLGVTAKTLVGRNQGVAGLFDRSVHAVDPVNGVLPVPFVMGLVCIGGAVLSATRARGSSSPSRR